MVGREQDAPSERNTHRHAKEKREDTLRTVYFIFKTQVFILFEGLVSVIPRGRLQTHYCALYIVRAGSVALTKIDDGSGWVVERERGMGDETWRAWMAGGWFRGGQLGKNEWWMSETWSG